MNFYESLLNIAVLLTEADPSGFIGSYSIWFFFLPIIAGIVFFLYFYGKYRNAGKSYQFENKTEVEVSNVFAVDQYWKKIIETDDKRRPGANAKDVRDRLKSTKKARKKKAKQ